MELVLEGVEVGLAHKEELVQMEEGLAHEEERLVLEGAEVGLALEEDAGGGRVGSGGGVGS